MKVSTEHNEGFAKMYASQLLATGDKSAINKSK